MKPGSQILCADGSIVMEVISTDPKAGTVRARCMNNATLGYAPMRASDADCSLCMMISSRLDSKPLCHCTHVHSTGSTQILQGRLFCPALQEQSRHQYFEALSSARLMCSRSGLHVHRERKNVNLPGVVVDLPTLTKKDEVDLVEWGVPNDIDFIAASFVRKGQDLDNIRKVCIDSFQYQEG